MRLLCALRSLQFLVATAALIPCLADLAAQTPVGNAATQASPTGVLTALEWTRVADPKLPGGGVTARFLAGPVGQNLNVTAIIARGGTRVRTLLDNQNTPGSATPVNLTWDGRDAAGAWAGPGDYVLRIVSNEAANQLDLPISVIRLGIREIASLQGTPRNEWQMVYFRRGTAFAFYATPTIHEYYSVADTGQLADLDLNDGSPRPPVPLHTATDSPPLEGTNYEDDNYNFPLCWLAGASPVFAVKFGNTCIAGNGTQTTAGYPIAGLPIRCRLRDDRGNLWSNSDSSMQPGSTYNFTGAPLPNGVDRVDSTLTWSWQYSPDGGTSWLDIPGSVQTNHRFYTVLAAPIFATTAGTQNSGPWVEVVDYIATWKAALGLDTTTPAGVAETVVKGFSGQIGSLTTAIEGVRYDAYPLGGNGGASHYYLGFPPTNSTQLSRLLGGRANGVFVNCSDCASCTSSMMAMVGLTGVQMMRLGQMTLRAIRGIGAPSYTLSLWGGTFGHGFSYHHVVSRTAGTSVCDACLWVDVDGSPSALPGTPGYNYDRPWNTGQFNYMSLVATATVTWFLDPLPTIQ